jgi:glycosyltransferase involved in cell wall biosynthesis
MKRVLTILEYGGAAGQDIVRGSIFRDHFTKANISIRYMGRRPAGLRKIRASQSRLVQELTTTLEYRLALAVYEKLGMRLNDSRIIAASRNFDAIHLIKVSSLDFIKKLRSRTSARLVYDLGDALWLPYYRNQYPHIDDILSSVDAVTCDNRYGLEYAAGRNRETFLWPTISQVEFFDTYTRGDKPSLSSGQITLGWVGGYDTAYNLYLIWEVLEHIFKKYPHLHFRLLGVGKDYRVLPQFENVRVSVLPGYTRDTMIREVMNMDIGLFPMFDIENSTVRGILKALIYMSGGAVVVGSPRGEMTELIQDGQNGFLPDSPADWIRVLESLIEDGGLRQKVSAAALHLVRSNYTIAQSFDCLKKALDV